MKQRLACTRIMGREEYIEGNNTHDTKYTISSDNHDGQECVAASQLAHWCLLMM